MSSSQPTFFGNNCLPPLSPFIPNESPLVSSNSNLNNVFVEETDVSSRGPTTGLSSPREYLFFGNNINSHPPRKGHRRSNSDVPLGFSAMIQSSPQLVPISRHEILCSTTGNNNPIGLKRQEMDGVGYGIGKKSEGEVVDELFDANDKESLSRQNRSSRVVTSQFRHCRSLSMDGNFRFGDSSGNRVDQLSPRNSLSENSARIGLEFGHGEFSEIELKKIMSDERLAEIAVSDPKRAKRILANRQSAARSKERKTRYISELEHKVQTLQTEGTSLSAQIAVVQKELAELTNQNNELKFRIQAMEQQAHLRDALHESLTAEVQRLKLDDMEFREEGGRASNGTVVQMKHHMFPMQRQQHNQIQRLSVTTSKTSTTVSAAPASA
ncbi:hypothetical protein ACP275_14G311500 [Erythranthe tilingii]